MPGIWTQDDIDELKAAIRTGVLSVNYAGPPARSVTYHSLAEMRSLLAEMIADVAGTSGTSKTFRLASTRKGL